MGLKFRYEALLGYRMHLKEKAEIEYSRARQHLRVLKDELLEYQKEMESTRNELDGYLREKTDSDNIRNFSHYLGALKIWMAIKEKEIAEADKQVAKRLEELLAATKKFKIMEKLKERDLQKWKKMLNVMEQKQLSEVGVLRHGREFL